MGLKRLDAEDFLVSAERVSQTVWSGNIPTLSTFHTSSTQKSNSVSGDYYLSVYDKVRTDTTSEDQFDISYGEYQGKGTLDYNDSVSGYSPSRSVYGQLRSLLYETEEQPFFNFDGNTGTVGGSIYVISIERSRYKERLLQGSLSLTLTNGANSLTLTDNSAEVQLPSYVGSQRVYHIVSQSPTLGAGYGDGFGSKSGYTQNRGAYGLFLPDTGLIILNGDALDEPAGNRTNSSTNIGINLNTNKTANSDGQNPARLFDMINAGNSFTLNSEETITSDFVFVRARNSEFNYSENPSFTRGTTGEVYHAESINNPQVYATTIGLYNDANELVAVAKTSRPLLKDFTKEALVRVKLDF